MKKRIIAMLLCVCLMVGILPVTASAYSVKTESEIVNFLNGKVGTYYPAGLCLKFVSDSFAEMGYRGAYGLGSAYSYYCNLKNQGRIHTSSNDIPIGADVFYDGWSKDSKGQINHYGHVGIYVGNGEIVEASSDDYHPNGTVHRKKWNEIKTWYQGFRSAGVQYLGWAFHDYVTVLPDHKHSYANYVCSCGAFEALYPTNTLAPDNVFLVSSSTASLRSAPYKSGKVVRTLSKGTELTTTEYYNNKQGEIWYKVNGFGDNCYIKGSNISRKPPASILSIDELKVQRTPMDEGNDNRLLGYVISNYSISCLQTYLDGILIGKVGGQALVYSNDQICPNLDFSRLSVGTHTIRIVAQDTGGGSKEASVSFNVKTAIKSPIAEITAIENGKQVCLTCETDGVDIYYTLNGLTPSATSTRYENPLIIHETAALNAVAVKNGKQSAYFSQTVTVNPAAAPSIFTEYTADGTRITMEAEAGSKIYYSFGGDYHQYTAPLTVTSETEISAFAEKLGCTRSETATESATVAVPECPSFSSPANGMKIAQKQPISVSWNKVYNAASYQLDVYRDGEYAESIETEKTTVIYVAEEAADYSFRVQAKNVIGASDFSSEVGISSMAPVTVFFTDWNDTIIRSETVDYNTAYDDIQKPADPERRGYTFLYWGNRYYSNITEDLTIQACYKINTYKVTFLDQNGNRIGSQQTVEYDGSALEPDASTLSLATGYALLGWNVQAEAADSNCDFTHVDSNMTVKAVVGWGQPELPVVAEITSATRNDDQSNGNYEVTVQLTNYPDEFTTALLRVSLKTAEGKMVKTESRTVGLRAGATSEFAFTLNYGKEEKGISSTATKVEAVVLRYNGDQLTGSAFSKAVSSDVTVISAYVWGNWSEWSTEMPTAQDGREIETKVQYAYKTKSTKTSNSPTIDGWNRVKTTWGSWSGWQDTAVSKTESREVETRTLEDTFSMIGVTCGNSAGYRCYMPYRQSGYSLRMGPYYCTLTAAQLYSCTAYAPGAWYGYATNVQGYIIGPGTAYVGEATGHVPYFIDGVTYKTQYRYRTATYSFEKISDFSDWQDSAVSVGGDISEVTTRTMYRYRDKNVPQYEAVSGIEDTSGEFYTLDGTLPIQGDIDLSGKLATVMVYKGKNSDPNESQLQYVGQTTIGANNSYSLSFKTKDVPSISTGDFVVCLGVQGSTGLVNIGMISAPKSTYSVNYYGISGNKIGETQTVEEGCDAAAPAAPAVEGYTFVAWSETGRNIHSDLDITAIYVPVTYAVVFVDWQNGTALPYALPYGADLTEYAESLAPSAAGYDFLYWDAIYDGQTTVTGNMVISAVYEPEKYTVNFYDGSDANKKLVSSQQVAYGEDAQLPDIPTYENRVFIAWDTSTPWWDVTGNVDVCAITAYTLTAEEPVSNLGDFTVGMAETLELSAGENALIYYTTDGTDPIPGENGALYVAGIPLTDTTEVRAVAVEDGKNNSEVIVVEFYYDEGFDGEFYEDIRTIETYEPIVKANDTVELTLKINKNPGLLGSLFFIDCDTSVYYLDCVENGEYAYTPGEIASDGMFVVAPYENGWKVLFFGSEAITGDGSLFSLKLKVNPDAMSGTYPITVSYSAENMLGTDYLEKEVSCESVISGTAVRGDINGDGEMTLADVVMILRHVVGLDVLSGLTALNAADVNNDGSINVVDALRLARYIAGLESSLR